MITPHVCRDPEDAAAQAARLLTKLLTPKPVLFLASGGSSLKILSYLSGLSDLSISVLDERGDNLQNLQKTKIFKESSLVPLTEKNLRDWTGRIVITQGIGPDGHTAGIMPYPENPTKFAELFDTPDYWVVTYDATGKSPYPHRTTVTMPFLRKVDAAIVYACGQEKQGALTKVFAFDGRLAATPARIIHEMSKVDLFTDLPLTG